MPFLRRVLLTSALPILGAVAAPSWAASPPDAQASAPTASSPPAPVPAPPAASPPPAPSAPGAPSAASTVHSVDEAQLASLLANPTAGPLVVAFFATWCAPCARELPELQRLVDGAPGVSTLLVSLDDAKEGPRVERFAVEHGLTLPIAHLVVADPGAAVARLVPGWPDRIPVVVVLNPGGAERARFVGALRGVELLTALTVRDSPPASP